ncbi:hypothetical protein IKF84_02250 [Candidatus Saccharibacteria bacterium]|nr:hypothetical protein [Candidatus Saccharibacteria bacterium]
MDPSYNNSGIIASGPDEPVAPVNNVVVDGGGGPRQSRRGLLIAGIALIGVALVAGIIALIVMTGNIDNNSTKSSDVINVPSFNRLINYVVSGTESDKVLSGNYDVRDKYYLLKVGSDEKEEAYNRTAELMKDFVDDYMANYTEGQDENENRKRITVLVDSTNEQFDFIKVIESTDRPFGYEISQMGKEKGSAAAKKQAMAHYDFSGMEDNSYTTEFMKAYEAWVDALLNNLDGVNAAYKNVEPYYNMVDDFIGNLYSINDLMKGETAMGGQDSGEAENE